MRTLVDLMAALTACREREALDRALIEVALRTAAPGAVLDIYRCVVEAQRPRWWRVAHGCASPDLDVLPAPPVQHDEEPPADWPSAAALPVVDVCPPRLQCLLDGRAVLTADDGMLRWPMETGVETGGVLEVQPGPDWTPEHHRLIESVLRVYRNVVGLLDYGERDSLTGLLNRKTFDATFLRHLAQLTPVMPEPQGKDHPQRRRESQALWLGVIDIDHFKRVNDQHGHLIGDEVLLLVAQLMRSTFRRHDRLYRFGGEEFVALLRCSVASDAGEAFERLRSRIEGHTFPQIGRLTISVGYTMVQARDTPASAFERADQAVYQAKQRGRNQVRHHLDLVEAGVLSGQDRDSDVELF